jgi:tRNA dimethylallyltransferase
MWWHDIHNPLIVIVGPTAVGKTNFSIKLAQKLNAEIISADSRYFYKGMDIGTAKPTILEMEGIRHHLIDVSEPEQTWSLAEFQKTTYKIISEIHSRDSIPLLVGGTGQYIKCIVEGWEMPEQARDDRLREILESEVKFKGNDFLYAYLEKVDPKAAAIIDPRNIRRTLRAIEVILRTGQRFSDQRKIIASPYSRKIIGLIRNRVDLYKRIDQRIDNMIANGLIQEVKNLLIKGHSAQTSSMSAIGYREICRFINGEISLDEAVVLMKRNTRQFVRRQANWFKEDDPNIKWFNAEEIELEVVLQYVQVSNNWLPPNK